MRTTCIAVLFLLFCEEASMLTHGFCNITPQQGLNLNLIAGRWYGLKITVPQYLCSHPITDGYWDVSVDPSTGSIHIIITGSYTQYPYGCASFPADLTPIGMPGVYDRRGKEIIYDIDQVITHTDYHNYLVVAGCITKLQKGCEPNVLTFSRRPYDGNVNLVKFLDNIISTKLCIDIRRTTYVLRSPLGPPTCSAKGGYKK